MTRLVIVENETIIVRGKVIKCLPNARFIVKIIEDKYPNYYNREFDVGLSGKIASNKIRVIGGDIVDVKIDTKHEAGRISFRVNKKV